MSKKIGLALSGGGIRGAAHVGLLKRLEERGIEPSVVAGTSAGAIVGALYAAGHGYEVILDFFREQPLFDFSHFSWTKPGFMDTDFYSENLQPFFESDDFAALKKELYVVTTEILQGEKRIFSSGPLIKPVLASAALPGIFSPVRMGDGIYVDGGVFNNFPSDIIRDKCDVLIGMNVNAIPEVTESQVDSTFSVLRRVYELTVRQQAIAHEKFCDIVVTSEDLVNFNEFDQSKVEEMFEVGYREAVKSLENI